MWQRLIVALCRLMRNTFTESWQYYLSFELLNQKNRLKKSAMIVCFATFVDPYQHLLQFALSRFVPLILMTRKGSEIKSYKILSVWMMCMNSKCISFLFALISPTINTSIKLILLTHIKPSSTSRSLFNM